MTIQISIIGLDQVGVSLGLALGNHKDLVRRVGSDVNPAAMRRAEKLGAVDHLTYNIPSAVRQADLVILAVAVDDLEETFKTIAEDLKEGAVVIDTSPVKIAATEWAKKTLREGQSFVSWTPALNPTYLNEAGTGADAAHADLFQNSLVYVTAPLGTPAEALKLASDLVTLVGGTPMFADPYEVDGLIAASYHLPGLTAAALFNTLQDQPGWRENQRFAGKNLASASAPVQNLTEREAFGQAILLNRDNVLRLLDHYIASLTALREMIADQNAQDLQAQLKRAVDGHLQWHKDRRQAAWLNAEKPPSDLPSSSDMWKNLFGLGGSKKKSR